MIDRLPGDVLGGRRSAGAATGFKHAPGVGETLASLVATGARALDLTPFAALRLG